MKKQVKKTSTERRGALITDENVASLAKEAARAGDDEMVRICGRALSGDKRARRECFRVILAARAMRG